MESDLERALIQQIEKFLLELGRGFMFVGTQQRVTLNNTHYYVDMVFYNKILRAYVLIELKTTKLTPEAAGQINMYLNYYAAEVNDPDDNPPIGIILCTDKDGVLMLGDIIQIRKPLPMERSVRAFSYLSWWAAINCQSTDTGRSPFGPGCREHRDQRWSRWCRW